MKESVVFYKSFYEAIVKLPQEYQLELYNAIFNYAFEGVEPTCLSPVAEVVFTLAKPNIDSAQRKYEASKNNGAKGGRPKKNNQTETQEKPNENPEITKDKPDYKPNENLNVDVDVNEDVDDDVNVEMKLFFKAYPQVQIDITSHVGLDRYDFALLRKEFDDSDYLRLNCNSLNWLLRNYKQVVSGKYRNKPVSEGKPVVDGSLYDIL